MTDIDRIIEDFCTRGWKSEPCERLHPLFTASSVNARRVVLASVDRVPKGATFQDDAFTFLDEADWPEVIDYALRAFANDPKNQSAAAVIHYASLQAVSALHPHLEAIFRLAPNRGSRCENWPWREAGEQSFNFLRSIIEDDSAAMRDRRKAWLCLLETRDMAVLDKAVGLVENVDLNLLKREGGYPEDCDVNSCLREVGFEFQEGALRRLALDQLWHIAFPREVLLTNGPGWWLREGHPTWRLAPPESISATAGGEATVPCGRCKSQAHRILTLEPIPSGLPITDLSRLEFMTCLSCLGWEVSPMFYRHDAAGRPHCLAEASDKAPQFPAGPLMPCTVGLFDAGRRWHWQDWGASNGRQNLNRVGGHPTWVQSAEYPVCPECHVHMPFIFQFDSDLISAAGSEWMWGSGGILYGFWCDRCRISALLWQCT